MKFKASLQDPHMLLRVLQVCCRIQRGCLIQLHSTRTRFFTKVGTVDGVQVWVGCHTKSLFSDFRCDSHDEEQSITFEVLDISQFIHSIKQAGMRPRWSAEAKPLVMRLGRSGKRPVLKLTMQGHQGLPDLSYDNPIRIFSKREIEGMRTPSLGDERLQVVIPNVVELTTFVERLKNAQCEHVTFSAQRHTPSVDALHSSVLNSKTRNSQNGRVSNGAALAPPHATLMISAGNFFANFALSYDAVEMIPRKDSDTDNAQNDENDSEEENIEEPHAVVVMVGVKKFARFFSSVRDIDPTRTSVYLVHNAALVLSVYTSNGTTMVAYIPASG
ncbi:unnamed protein product [Phytomonas sp. Hart1]|nr:unnamed protein product [Phytomonas sp. Hart1]|eukprot:CCW68255.1 unnamed protein product [Phytomonas sp. isolate Hart1]